MMRKSVGESCSFCQRYSPSMATGAGDADICAACAAEAHELLRRKEPDTRDRKHTIAATPEMAALLRRYQEHASAAETEEKATMAAQLGQDCLDIVGELLDAEIVDLSKFAIIRPNLQARKPRQCTVYECEQICVCENKGTRDERWMCPVHGLIAWPA